MSIDPNEFLMGGGVKSASFPSIGTTVSGRVARNPEVRQQTDAKDGSPKFFSNGDPMMQLVIQVQTDQRDPSNSDDDGTRALYIKSNMLAAVRDAVRKSGAKGLEVGGTLTITYTADGERKGNLSAPKLYTATYRPPSGEAANNVLMGNAPVSPAPTGQPAATPAGQPPAGVDPAIWDQMGADQRASVLAAMAGAR